MCVQMSISRASNKVWFHHIHTEHQGQACQQVQTHRSFSESQYFMGWSLTRERKAGTLKASHERLSRELVGRFGLSERRPRAYLCHTLQSWSQLQLLGLRCETDKPDLCLNISQLLYQQSTSYPLDNFNRSQLLSLSQQLPASMDLCNVQRTAWHCM